MIKWSWESYLRALVFDDDDETADADADDISEQQPDSTSYYYRICHWTEDIGLVVLPVWTTTKRTSEWTS
jgi:hypothetical protein